MPGRSAHGHRRRHRRGPRFGGGGQAGHPIPDVRETSINGAKGVLLNITGGSDMGIMEVTEAAEYVQAAADPEANIIFGAGIDESSGDTMRITVTATGFDYVPSTATGRPQLNNKQSARPAGTQAQGQRPMAQTQQRPPIQPIPAHLSAGHGGSSLYPPYDDPARAAAGTGPASGAAAAGSFEQELEPQQDVEFPGFPAGAPLPAHERAQHRAQLQPRCRRQG